MPQHLPDREAVTASELPGAGPPTPFAGPAGSPARPAAPAPVPPGRSVTLGWMRDGTALVERLAEELSDVDIAGPCALPGWARAHLLSHLARNADALVNLTTWARTGVATPMYTGPDQRAADIEQGATRPAGMIRDDLRSADARLAEALSAMRPQDWAARVRSGKGREIPAEQIVWLRVREVWIHAVDLATGVGFADLPAPLVDALLDDVCTALSTRDGCPAVTVAPVDRGRRWTLGAIDPSAGSRADPATGERPDDPVTVSGPAASLVRWLTGRGVDAALTPRDTQPPALPAWL